MKKKGLILIDCSEAARFCDKAQYREANLMERFRLRLHYYICESCQKYQTRNSRLTRLIQEAGIQTCTSIEKENFRRKMAEESSKQFKEP